MMLRKCLLVLTLMLLCPLSLAAAPTCIRCGSSQGVVPIKYVIEGEGCGLWRTVDKANEREVHVFTGGVDRESWLKGPHPQWYCKKCKAEFSDAPPATTSIKSNGANLASVDVRSLIDSYNNRIRLNPNDWQAYLFRGSAYAGLGQTQQAIDDYSKAISINPKKELAYCYRGDAYSQLKQYNKAIDDYTKATNSSQPIGEAYCSRGKANYALGQYQKAIDDFTTYCDKYNSNPVGNEETYCYRAHALGNLRRYKEAINDYNLALDAYNSPGRINSETMVKPKDNDPSYAWAYSGRADAYYSVGEYQKAVDDYTQAITAPSETHSKDYYNRGKAYEKLDKKDLAARDEKMATQLGYKPEAR